jgi:UDP-2,3-diacylglucosamine pyrophosphatase LpxH
MRRVVTISDLHIGGAEHPMLGHPEILTGFLEQLATYQGDEEVELVVAGDFIDFLAEPPYEAWTASESKAVEKLQATFSRLPGLFDAFARCADKLSRFTVLLGNHDIELVYPRVRDALFRRLGTGPHRCHFIQGNEAYRVGELLIEHGNRYDPWNAIDHHGLRQIASCASRGEQPPRPLDVCPGSQLVSGAMNPLKERYHFIDLLKPEGKILALLLLEIEPTAVKKHLRGLFSFASQWLAQHYRKAQWAVLGDGVSPTNERLVATGDEADALPLEIRRAFHEELNELEAHQQRSAATGDPLDLLRKAVLGNEQDGLRAMFERRAAVPEERLAKLQVALRGMLDGDRTFDRGFADGECHAAAHKMVAAGVAKVVVMGHTHLARDVELPGGGRYLNTGTWADLIRIDPRLLGDTGAAREELTAWLRQLSEDRLDGIREPRPSYADVRVNDEGHVVFTEQMLRDHRPEKRFA